MRRTLGIITMVTLLAPGGLMAERAASLRGSPASMQEQNRVAKQHSLPFYRSGAEIRAAAERGDLAELTGDANYSVADFVRYPYLQPEALLFVERLAAQYRAACGQKLVVTSAVRPISEQPSNSHALSVHPAGMAVDLRVSDRAACRSWLETSILNLERQGVLNGIREFRPPHYHIAIYPSQYYAYAQERMAAEAAAAPEPVDVVIERGIPETASAFVAADPDETVTTGRRAGPAQLALAAALLLVPAGFAARRRRRG
jgi:hypothetical protein